MHAKLVVIGKKQAGMEIPISGPRFLIGRGEGCQFRVLSQRISRRHCIVSIDGASATIEDCGSANGTFVNGEKVLERRELHNGDRIALGTLVLEVCLDAGERNGENLSHDAHAASGSMATNVSDTTVNEAVILHWLEDEEGMAGEDEERYWRKATAHGEEEGVIPGSDAGKIAVAAQGQESGGLGAFAGGMGGAAFDGEPPTIHHRPKSRRKRLLRRMWLVARAPVAWLYRPLRGLQGIDLLLLGAIVILSVAVVAMWFPAVGEWCKRILDVRKWPFWVWTGVFTVASGFLIWLRSRYE